MAQSFTPDDVKKVASLANIPIDENQLDAFAAGFTSTMKVVDTLSTVDVGSIEATHHTTGIENVYREDVVDIERMFTQEEALMNAKRTYNGYFVVDQVIDQE